MAVYHRDHLTLEHRMKIGARQIGMSLDEYRRHFAAGEKWCCGHRAWHPREAFGKRESLPDGLENACRAFVNARARLCMRRLRERRRAQREAVARGR